VHAAIESVRPSAVVKGVALDEQLEGGATPIIGDASRAQQIVSNLVANAIEFTPRGGSVTVTLRRNDEAAEILVADTGRGITADFLPHAFDRFRQGDASTTRLHGGLGLGLAIVRHLTELHGGSVAAHSEGDGRGATFVVRIPLSEPPAAPDAALGSQPESARDAPLAGRRLKGLRILVVDDEPDVRDLVGTVFTRSGAEVRTAASSREALAVLDSWTPSVVVCDIAMPAEDGYRFIQDLRSRPPERGGAIPAAALTAYARPEDREKALAAGYQAHIVKPADPEELAKAVGRLVRSG
jgi:CheY-like chemotaxis protein